MKKIFASTSLLVLATSIFTLGLGLSNGIKGVIPSVQARENEVRGKVQENEVQSEDKFECTAAQVSGNYGVVSNGFSITAPASLPPESVGPYAAVGRLTVNPDQTLSLNLTQSFNGIVIPATTSSLTGTFTINSDCTGSLAINNGVTYNFVVVDSGKEIQLIQTNLGSAITGVAKKQED